MKHKILLSLLLSIICNSSNIMSMHDTFQAIENIATATLKAATVGLSFTTLYKNSKVTEKLNNAKKHTININLSLQN